MFAIFETLYSFMMNYYLNTVGPTLWALMLIGFTPLFADKSDKPNAISHMLCVVRRFGFAYILFVGFIAFAVLCVIGTTQFAAHPKLTLRFENEMQDLFLNTLLYSVSGMGVAVLFKLLYSRFVATELSSLKRKFRFNVSGDKESDIRDVVGKLNTKKYLPQKFYKAGKIFIGLNAKNIPQYIDSDQFHETHTEIIGPTRTGKGVVMGVIANQQITRGNTFIFHDPKNDTFLPHILKESADKAGSKFIFFDLNEDGPGHWSPFEGGIKREQRSRLMWALGMKETGSDADFYKLGEKQTIDLLLSGNAWTPEFLFNSLTEFEGEAFRRAESLLKAIEPLQIKDCSGKEVMKALKSRFGSNSKVCTDLQTIFDKPGGKVGWGTRLPFWRWVQHLSGNSEIQSALKQLTLYKNKSEQLSAEEYIGRLIKEGSYEAVELAELLNQVEAQLKPSGWPIKKLINVLYQDAEDKQAKRAISSLNEMAQVNTFTADKQDCIDWEEVLSSETPHVIYIKGSLTDDLIRKMHRLLLVQLGQLIIRLQKEGRRHSHVTQMVDEVAFLTSMELSNDLATIGGYRCNMILAYQDPAQLRFIDDQTVDAEAVERSIHTNCQNKVIYRLAEDEMAEWAAGMTGKQFKTVKRQEKTIINELGAERWDEEASYNKVEEAYITPNVFKGLPQMVGVLITPGRLSSIVYTSFIPTEMKTDFNGPEFKPSPSPTPVLDIVEDTLETNPTDPVETEIVIAIEETDTADTTQDEWADVDFVTNPFEKP